MAQIGRANWETSDERAYIRNGRLEMAVKGEAGGEAVRLGVMDAQGQAAVVLLDRYAKITTEWQTVRVPLRLLKAGNANLDWSRIRSVQVTSASGRALTIWLADLRIVNPPGGED